MSGCDAALLFCSQSSGLGLKTRSYPAVPHSCSRGNPTIVVTSVTTPKLTSLDSPHRKFQPPEVLLRPFVTSSNGQSMDDSMG